jgi:hypothetical protein
LTQDINGPEIEFSPEYLDASHSGMRCRMRIGNQRLGQMGYPFAWDYGAACQSLTYTLDATDMTFRVVVKGQDNRSSTGGTLVWGNSVHSPHPPWAQTGRWPWLMTADTSHSSEKDPQACADYAVADMRTHEFPRVALGARIRIDGTVDGQPTGSPPIEALATGDTATFTVGAQRHPWLGAGTYGCRILGIASGSDPHTAKFDLQYVGYTP